MIQNGYRYTDETYYTKQQLQAVFPPSLLNEVWQEIQQYRQLFRLRLPCTESSVVLSSALYHRMQYTQQLWYLNHREPEPQNETLRCINSRYLLLYDKIKELTVQNRYGLSDDVLHFLAEEQIPLLLRMFASDRYVPDHLLACLLAMHYQLNDPCIVAMIPSEVDETPNFITYLDMVCVTMKKSRLATQTEETEIRALALRHPQLRAYQIAFYTAHRHSGYFYTLNDFRQFTQTSYETARYSMDELVQLGWYQKEKKGKKYVYYV